MQIDKHSHNVYAKERKKVMRIAMVMVVMVLIAVFGVSGCGKKPGSGKKTETSAPYGSTPSAKPTAYQDQNGVSIENFAFSPSSLEVPVGATVVWTNNDTIGHTVSSDDGKFDSGDLQPGKQFKFKFTAAFIHL